jgi:hypothetical protein
MSLPYRSVTIPVSFDYESAHFTARVEACRSMLAAKISAPFNSKTELVQIPMICLQGTKTGLVDEDCTALSEFGERVARGAILKAYHRRTDSSLEG